MIAADLSGESAEGGMEIPSVPFGLIPKRLIPATFFGSASLLRRVMT